MYGTGPTKVMNEARTLSRQNQDFVYSVPMKMKINGTEQIGYNVFSDKGAGTNALGIETTLSTYSFSQAPDDKFVILKSSLHNKASLDITGLYAGYYIDWDIPESGYSEDMTYFDSNNKIAIAYNNNDKTAPYTGAALISDGGYGYYPIENSATSGSVALNDGNGFTDAEKWYALSNGIGKTSAGVGDISLVISGGPYNIPADQSVDVAFAIAAAPTLQEVIGAINESKIKYQSIINNPPGEIPVSYELYQNYPNPFNPATVISYQLPAAGYVSLKIYDVLGREVSTLVNEEKTPGSYKISFKAGTLSSGVYFYKLTTGSFMQMKKMILLK